MKIERIRTSTSASSPPRIDDRIDSELLSEFQPVTTDEIAKLLVKSPAKQCLLDPAPTWLIKQCSDIVSPVIAAIRNASFDQVTFPHCCKKAIIRPRLKKPNFFRHKPISTTLPQSTCHVASYRPISNRSFLSKVVEKVVDVRLSDHMNRHHLLPVFQSAYRLHHSTETALARIINDMILVVDDGRVGALTLLDLSVAFDTVDHSVLTNVTRNNNNNNNNNRISIPPSVVTSESDSVCLERR